MKKMDNNYKKQLLAGEKWEARICRKLIKDGYSIIPAQQFSQYGSPFLLEKRSAKHIILPDLVQIKEGQVLFSEVKSKTTLNSLQETGIDFRHWENYVSIYNLGFTVYIYFIIKKDVYRVSIEQLSDLRPRHWNGKHDITNQYVMPPMCLWHINTLQKFKWRKNENN